MLLKSATLAAVADGRVNVQFRRWRRPTVKAGGTLITSIGQLAIHEVEPVELEALGPSDARAAGFDGLEALLDTLRGRSGQTYRIRLSLVGPDPRIALREALPDDEELRGILDSLRRRDVRSRSGPWTREVLELIAAHPSTRAAELAERAAMEKKRFKSLVRGLKSLGLTVSESVGYRLSPCGVAVLGALRGQEDAERVVNRRPGAAP